jgi:hypothetical protein
MFNGALGRIATGLGDTVAVQPKLSFNWIAKFPFGNWMLKLGKADGTPVIGDPTTVGSVAIY